jgi:ribA/ribD-fused uncharacterized protein
MDELKFYNEWEENGFLANYFMADMIIEGITYPSVEHYYQSKKTMDKQKEEAIRTASSCAAAKELGNRPDLVLYPDWNTRKIDVMKQGLKAKFTQHQKLKDMLLATGGSLLMENSQEDYFWGIGTDGSGKNMLGTLLMDLRHSLRRNPYPPRGMPPDSTGEQ